MTMQSDMVANAIEAKARPDEIRRRVALCRLVEVASRWDTFYIEGFAEIIERQRIESGDEVEGPQLRITGGDDAGGDVEPAG